MRRPRALARARRLALILLAAYGALAGVLLLTADGWAVNRANVAVWITVMKPLGLLDAVSPDRFGDLMNIVLFIPPLAALALLVPTWWWVAAGAGASCAVELYQGFLGSRVSSPVDVATNTTGSLLGVALGLAVHRWISGGAAPRGASAPHAPSDGSIRAGSPVGTARGPAGGSDDRG